MALTKIRLGDYIIRSTTNNHDLKYGVELIAGVTSQGIFDTPKGNPLEVNLRPYKIVNNGAFVYNPTRLNLGSIAYRTEGLCIVSHLYMVFYLTEEGKKIIDPIWLYIYFRRDEFRREVTFRNFGSQRPEFNFNDLSDIEIPLPDLPTQQKYVAVYKAMLANQQAYEQGMEDLKLAGDAYVENLGKTAQSKCIGPYLLESDRRNDANLPVESVRGLATSKALIPTKANMAGVSLSNYKTVSPRQIAYVPDTSRRGDKVSLGYNNTEDTYLVSSISTVFGTDENHLLPDYLMLFLTRSEFDRYARFCSWGSARETFDWDEMCNVKIPIPSIKTQRAISNIFAVYNERQKINEKLKKQIEDICPSLIKGSIDEARKEA